MPTIKDLNTKRMYIGLTNAGKARWDYPTNDSTESGRNCCVLGLGITYLINNGGRPDVRGEFKYVGNKSFKFEVTHTTLDYGDKSVIAGIKRLLEDI